MAVKTITIDLEAYEMLRRLKKEGQSFSQVIKENYPRAKTGRDLQRALRQFPLESETVDAIESQVSARKRHMPRKVSL